MPKVFTVSEDATTVPWLQFRCKDETKELQDLLEKNYDLLCGEQIDPEAPRRWLLIKREMPVPDPTTATDKWSIDFFFVDQDGMPTFVECKRYNDTRARREVVGQMLEYAANGQYYWDKDTLRQYAEKTTSASGKQLEDLVQTLRGDDSAKVDELFEQMVTNLKEGQIRLIFFLEESPYELRSIVDFLNKQMELAEVLIIEARQYVEGGSRLVIPLLFGFTEQARQVKKTVTITTGSQRKKWDETSFFKDAERHLTSDQLKAVRQIYEFSKAESTEMSWGTGATRGSFNPKFSHISNKSLYSVNSDGSLSLNFGWLYDERAAGYRDLLRREFPEITGLFISNETEFPTISISQWCSEVEKVIQAFTRVIHR